MKKLLVSVAALAAVAGAHATAVPIVQTFVKTIETTEIHQVANFNAFSANGTLDSVTIKLDGEALSSASFVNSAAQPQFFAFASTLQLFLTGTGISPLGEELDLSLFSYPRTLTPLGTTDLGSVDKTATATFTASSLSAFLSGPVSFSCDSVVANTQSGGGGNITVNQETKAGCGITLTYNWTEAVTPPPSVPEPASLALVGLALAGVAAARRRKA